MADDSAPTDGAASGPRPPAPSRRRRRGAETAGVEESVAPPGAVTPGLGSLIRTSYPDEIPRHNISDEELGMLYEPRRKSLTEAKWACVGVAGGAFVSAVAAIVRFASEQSVTGVALFVDLLQIVVLFVAAAVAVAVWVIDRRLAHDPTNLAEKIRARSRREGHGNE